MAEFSEYIPGFHGGKLILVAHEDQFAPVRHGPDQSRHEFKIDHGGFIDNDYVGMKRIQFMMSEGSGHAFRAEHLMEGGGFCWNLPPNRFREPAEV